MRIVTKIFYFTDSMVVIIGISIFIISSPHIAFIDTYFRITFILKIYKEIVNITFSQAKSTGAVAKPSFKSVAVGLPIASDDETKSKRSSTNWKANPMLRPYWKAISDSESSAPAKTANYLKKN